MSRSVPRVLASLAGAAATVAVLALLVVVLAPQAIGATASYVVLSGSMEPAIEAGDLVVVRSVPPDEIERGDVITFTDAANPATTDRTDRVTHRVVGVNRSTGTPRFETKGDANEDPDPGYVTPDQLVGEVWFHVPAVGHLIVFAGTRNGILLFVVVPGVLLVVSELYSVYTDALVEVEVEGAGAGAGAGEVDGGETTTDDSTAAGTEPDEPEHGESRIEGPETDLSEWQWGPDRESMDDPEQGGSDQ